MTSLPVTRPAPELPPGPRAALVIAVGDYADAALTRLEATARDATEMADVLANPDIGSFEVTSVVNQTAQEIRLAVEDFLEERSREDLIVVYLSCHGLLDRQDRFYFAATDTRTDRLATTGVAGQWLWDRLEECRATCQVVILDCCNSGAFGRAGAKGEAVTDLRLSERFTTQGRGRAVLTASRANQRAWEGDAAGEGPGASVFTTALVEGLRTGAADANGRGYISVDDAYEYAYRKVQQSGAGQVPQRDSTGEGTMVLARNPVGLIIHPAPLPEDLNAALDSAKPAIRIGAVHALGDWLTGADPARALSAEQTLRRIATTEVLAVATVARAYLNAGEAQETAPPQADEPARPPASQPAGPTPDEPARPPASQPAAGPGEATPSSVRESSSGAARLLMAGFIALAAALGLTALDLLLNTIIAWPWWTIAGVSVAGIFITMGGRRDDGLAATLILFNLAWFTIYSLTVIILIEHNPPETNVALLVTECVIAAVANAALCIWIAALRLNGNPRADPLLAALAGGLLIGLVLAAIAIVTAKRPVWDTVAIVSIGNALLGLLAAARALRQTTASGSPGTTAPSYSTQPGA